MTTKSKVVCALLAALASGCGLPLPTEGATDCGRNVYLEVGVTHVDCAAATSWVQYAEERVGVNLASLTVEYMAGDTLASLGYKNAWGRWQPGSVAVVSWIPATMLHEALHERDGGGHCNWSTRAIPLFEREHVPGSFDDECANVYCTSTRFWVDDAGIGWGDTYVCKAL